MQEKYDTWRLPCCLTRDRIAAGLSFALFDLSTADRSYGGDAAAVFLDCGDSRSPAAEEFRTSFLFFVFGAGFLFWRVAPGPEWATVLLDDSPIAWDFLLGRSVLRSVVLAFVAGALAGRVRANP